MPYITQEKRLPTIETTRKLINLISEAPDKFGPGDLNYIISRIIGHYISKKGLCYQHINDVVGVLECAKLEVYRRLAGPYENNAIKKNGDLYIYRRLQDQIKTEAEQLHQERSDPYNESQR